MPEEETQPEGLRPEFLAPFKIADRVMRGESPEEALDSKKGSGELLDLNHNLSDVEKTFGLQWIEKRLGSSIDKAEVKERYKSPDGQTQVTIFKKRFTDGWFLSKWQNEGDQSSFIFWPYWVYEMQVENSGYQIIE